MTTTITDLDRSINTVIHNLSELTPAELSDLNRMLERAYVHVLIEQHLRVNDGAQVAGVSLLRPKDPDR
jgi:hypothetical protein